MELALAVKWVPIVAMERLFDRMKEDATVRGIVREMLARAEKHEAEILGQNVQAKP